MWEYQDLLGNPLKQMTIIGLKIDLITIENDPPRYLRGEQYITT